MAPLRHRRPRPRGCRTMHIQLTYLPKHHCRSPQRPGVVLLAVLVVVVLLTLAAYQFSESMMAEYEAADSYARSAQARAMAESGVNFAMGALSTADNITNALNENLYDNAQAFQGVI